MSVLLIINPKTKQPLQNKYLSGGMPTDYSFHYIVKGRDYVWLWHFTEANVKINVHHRKDNDNRDC